MIRISLAVVLLSTAALAQEVAAPPDANPQQQGVTQDQNAAQQQGVTQEQSAAQQQNQTPVQQQGQSGAQQQGTTPNADVPPVDHHAEWGCEGKWGGKGGEGAWMEHHYDRYERWGRSDPWHLALEAGGVFGTGLTAQLSLRAWSFALGVGAIGFGDRSLDRFRSDDHDHGLTGGVTQGYFLSFDRYSTWGRSGFFYGAKLGVADSFLFDKDGNRTAFWGGFITPEIGAQFFPFQRNVFVKPAIGATVVLARFSHEGDAPIPPFIVPSFSISVGAAL